MEGEEPAEGSDVPKRRQFFNRIPLTNLWRVLIVAVLALTAGFGGLDKADQATSVALGEAYDNGPLSITPRSLYVQCDPSAVPKILEYNPRQSSAIVLEADIQSHANETVPLDIPIATGTGVGIGADIDPVTGANENRTPSSNVFTLDGTVEKYSAVISMSARRMIYSLAPRNSVSGTMIWITPRISGSDKDIRVFMYDLAQRPMLIKNQLAWEHADIEAHGALHVSLQACP